MNTPQLAVIEPRSLAVCSVDYCRSAITEPAEARINRTTYDPAGRAITQRDPRRVTDALAPANLTTIYSLSGKVLSTISVDAGWRISLPGEAGQLVHGWDGRGSQRWNEYDDQLRPLAVFEQGQDEPSFCTERYYYGGADSASAAHNQCGQLIRHDDPAGTQLFTEFGMNGGLLEQTRHFLRELTSPDWPEPVAERNEWLEPGPGAMTRSRFNAQGELLEQTDAKGNRQSFSHTVAGQLREVRLQLLKDTAPTLLVGAIQYNAHGQTAREVAGNGVITTLEYAPQDARLTRLHARRGNNVLQDSNYEYDPTGNVLRIEDAAVPVRYFANQRIDPVNQYAYDSLYQLISATGWEAGGANKGPQFSSFDDPGRRGNYRQTYRYDRGGNLLELTHEGPQNQGHRLVAAPFSNRCLPVVESVEPGDEDFRQGFDANGNLLKLQPGQTLSWDLRNQLREVQPIERACGMADREQYLYGADGMRVRKVRSTQTKVRTVISEVRYLPNLEVRTHNGSGEQFHVISVQAGRSSVRVLHWETAPPKASANDQYRFCLNDHLGSCTLELDSDGEVISQERYHSFGTTSWFAGRGEVEASRKTVRYSGKERDATGLYYYGFRYYVAWLQRWLNPDPAGDIDGENRYRMVRNNPVVLFDMYGLMPDSDSALSSVRQSLVSKRDIVKEVTEKLGVMLRDIAVTDIPYVNRFGLGNYHYDENRTRVRQRRVEVARSFGLGLAEAVFNKNFQLALAEKVASERDKNNKIFGQCAEMAYLAASRINNVADRSSYHIYSVQLSTQDHTLVLLSKLNYRSGDNVVWTEEYKSKAIVVDLWSGVLIPTKSAALIALAKDNRYTKNGRRAIVQAKLWSAGVHTSHSVVVDAAKSVSDAGTRTKRNSIFSRFGSKK